MTRRAWSARLMSSTAFTLAATAKHTATVIFLHGLGETGYKWSVTLERIRSPYIKYICPTAKTMPLSVNAGAQKTAWYDVYHMAREPGDIFEEDCAGIKEAAKLVHEMVEEEISHSIDSKRIVLGGFSQGGGLALYSALTSKRQLAGILVLSSRLPFANTFPHALEGNLHTPILQCHGDCDSIVRLEFRMESSQLIKTFCTNHELKTYKGLGHGVCDEEMQDVKSFISKHLPPLKCT